MSNALINVDLSKSAFATKDALDTVTKAGDYLPRIQVMGGNSDLVKRGNFPLGQFALFQGKNPTSLTKEFTAVLISMRPKAMQFSPIKSVYDSSTQDFKDIQAKADEGGQSGCGYGPEYLLWLPDYQLFATLFLSNKSGRAESGKVQGFMTKACTFKCELAENKKRNQAWHVAAVSEYTGGTINNMPEEAKLIAVASKFNNPPQVEQAEEAEGAERAR